MTLNGQCLRLADEPIKLIDTDMKCVIDATENNPIMTDSLPNLVKESKSILFIASADIGIEIYDYIFNLCKNKSFAVISDNIPTQYMRYQTIFNQGSADDYVFFGASAGRAPMLVNKHIYDYDLVIVASSVIMNAYAGFLGSITTLFNAVTAPKTVTSVIQNALQDSVYNVRKLSSGVTIRNPIYESIREGLIAAGKAIHSFSINIVSDYKNIDDNHKYVFAGDLFLSQIEAQNIIIEQNKAQVPPSLYDGLEVKTDCYNNVAYFATLIEEACKKLLKGGRLLIKIDGMSSFGNKVFHEIFYRNTLSEIADNVDENNSMESFYAFILKYYASNYHIALPFNKKFNDVFIQAGLNPLKDDDYNQFLSNCSNKGSI